MTELGLVYGGHPLAFHGWAREARVRALAWAKARHAEPLDTVTTTPPIRAQVVRLINALRGRSDG